MKNCPYPKDSGKVKWVSTDWLERNLENSEVMIMDVQPDIHDYLSEHVPGAVYFNPRLLRVPLNGRPGVYVPDKMVKPLFERVRLESDVPVVVYTGVVNFRGWGDGLEQTMLAYSLA